MMLDLRIEHGVLQLFLADGESVNLRDIRYTKRLTIFLRKHSIGCITTDECFRLRIEFQSPGRPKCNFRKMYQCTGSVRGQRVCLRIKIPTAYGT